MNRRLSLHVSALIALVTSFTPLALADAGQAARSEGAQVGNWKTYVLSSGSEIAAPAGTLASLFPDQAKRLAAMAQEAGLSRLLAGTNYRGDVDAGMALGKAVADRAIARAAADGSDAKFTGTIPTGPGIWNGTNP